MKNVFEIMFRWCLTYDAVYIIHESVSHLSAFAFISRYLGSKASGVLNLVLSQSVQFAQMSRPMVVRIQAVSLSGPIY